MSFTSPRRTGALVIGTESNEYVMRAYGIPEEHLITVRGGDYDFGTFSVKVIPSLHSPLDHKHYFSSETAAVGMKAPLSLQQKILANPLAANEFACWIRVLERRSTDHLGDVLFRGSRSVHFWRGCEHSCWVSISFYELLPSPCLRWLD